MDAPPRSFRGLFLVLATPAVLVVTALVALTGGCGLRADELPQPIPRERLDERLFQEGSDSPAGSRWASIFVLSNRDRNPRLVSVDVPVPGGQRYERAVLETLLAWSPDRNRSPDLRLTSLIPSDTTLRSVQVDGDVLSVDLANLTIEGTGQAQALAQIVYTATAIPGISYVRFSIDGKQVAVPLEDKTSSPGARLSRDDFPALRPEPTTTTTEGSTTSEGSTTTGASASPSTRPPPTAPPPSQGETTLAAPSVPSPGPVARRPTPGGQVRNGPAVIAGRTTHGLTVTTADITTR